MASAMRKMAVYLGLVEDDDRRYQDKYDSYEDYDEYDDDEPDMTEPSPGVYAGVAPRGEAAGAPRADYNGYTPADNRLEPVVPQQVDLLRITTLHPRTYNEARTIGEHFREGTPVIMNLTEMVDSDARRLVDFAAGLIFGLRGSIDKVTNKVFLLSPANVEVTAEDKARIAERGFFNQS
jgi:cell division inhibitor SepF